MMHLLVISLLSILAGTLLLAKARRESLDKFFKFISWFFIVVGFILFIGFIAGGINKMAHHRYPGIPGIPGFRHEMMMRSPGRGIWNEMPPPPGRFQGNCCVVPNCMKHDSIMKCCPLQVESDTTKLP